MQQPQVVRSKSGSEFKQTALRGIGWSLVSQVGRQLAVFVFGVILARLLSPTEFGLIGMITVIAGFAAIFADLGFGAALVQRKDLRQEHLSSVFWLDVASGAILIVLFMICSPLIASFYREPLLQPLTLLISLTFIHYRTENENF